VSKKSKTSSVTVEASQPIRLAAPIPEKKKPMLKKESEDDTSSDESASSISSSAAASSGSSDLDELVADILNDSEEELSSGKAGNGRKPLSKAAKAPKNNKHAKGTRTCLS
jgi:hypothetical protein